MADFASSRATVVKARTYATPSGKIKIRELTLVLEGEGITTAGSQITAASLGFTRLIRSSMLQKDDNTLAYPTCPSYNGGLLLIYRTDNTTPANHAVPAVATGTFRITVEGV